MDPFLNILYDIWFHSHDGIQLAYAWIPMAVMAGLGAAKSANEAAIADKSRSRQAAVNRWAPWTGQFDRSQIQSPNTFGNIAQGAYAGSQMGDMFGGGGEANAMTQNTPNGSVPMVNPNMKYKY